MTSVNCSVCLIEFEASRQTAKFCSDRCRQVGHRGSKGSGSPDLESITRADLATAGVADSVLGQVALEVARQLVKPGTTGISSLSKEFRLVVAEALAGSESVKTEQPVGEDQMDQIKERRERKARTATGRA